MIKKLIDIVARLLRRPQVSHHILSFPLVGNPSVKRDCGQAAMTTKGVVLPVLLVILFALSGTIQASDIDDVLNKAKKEGKAVMLELGSVGCIPCERMKPVMEKLREKYKGKLEVLFIDVKKDKETARKFGVYAIPTQVFLDKNGKEFHRHIGYYDYEEIVPVLKKAGI